jgi:hypothetical protein
VSGSRSNDSVTVVWSRRAENQLAQLWTDSSDRQAITDAANALDATLANDPQTKGVALTEGMRTIEIPPLHALFYVQEDDRLVRVVLIRRVGPPSSPTGNGQMANS